MHPDVRRMPSSTRARLFVAIAASAGLVLASPFVGVARSQLQSAFPTRFGLVVNAVVGMVVLSTIALGVARIRYRRAQRLGTLALASLIAVAYVWQTGNADASIRAVETFHFVEYGAITLLYYVAWRHLNRASTLVLSAGAAFVSGVADEAYQWFLPARVGELNDVWLNGVAIVCGLMASAALIPPTTALAWSRDATGHVCRILAVVCMSLAGFVHLVHLGVEIREGNAVFVSRFSAAGLDRAQEIRRDEWRNRPPLVRPDRLSREDQYMTEALQHVQARNTAWTAGDAPRAWHENAILERYFAVVLDTPSYVAKEGHRWPAEQRREAALRAQADIGAPLTSEAYPYSIYTWSPTTLWAIALAIAGTLVWAGRPARPARDLDSPQSRTG